MHLQSTSLPSAAIRSGVGSVMECSLCATTSCISSSTVFVFQHWDASVQCGTTNAAHRCSPYLHPTSVFSTGAKRLYAEPCSPGLICFFSEQVLPFSVCCGLCFNGLSIHKMAETQSRIYSASQIVPLHMEVVNAGGQKWNKKQKYDSLLYSAQMALSLHVCSSSGRMFSPSRSERLLFGFLKL